MIYDHCIEIKRHLDAIRAELVDDQDSVWPRTPGTLRLIRLDLNDLELAVAEVSSLAHDLELKARGGLPAKEQP